MIAGTGVRARSRRSLVGIGVLALVLVACTGRSSPTATTAPAARSPVAGNTGRGTGTTGGGRGGAGVPSGQFNGGVAGLVALINGTMLRVRLADASVVSVEVSPDTAVRVVVSGTTSDLKVGEIVAVQGDKTGDTTYTATALTVTGAGAGRGTPTSGTPATRAQGGVPRGATRGAGGTAPNGTAPAGGGGVPRGAGGGAPASGTARAGGPGGAPQGTGNGGPAGGFAGALVGTISAVEDGKITVQSQAGDFAVTLGTSTVVRVERAGTFSDIHVNDNIVVQGDMISDADYNARLITDQGP